MRFALYCFILASGPADAGVFQSAAEYVDSYFSGSCVDGSAALKKITERAKNCSSQNYFSNQMRELANKVVDENQYFAALAYGRAEDLKCDRDQLRSLQSGSLEMLAENAAEKVAVIRKLDVQIRNAEIKATQDNQMLMKGTLKGKVLAEAVRKNNEEFEKLKMTREVVAASIPLIQFPRVQQLIEASISPNSTGENLASEIHTALASQVSDYTREGKAYERGTRKPHKMSSEQLGSLAKDTHLVDRVIGGSPSNSQVLARIACESNARYGDGRDRLDTGLAVGSLLVSGGAFGFVRTLAMARNAGWITRAATGQKLGQMTSHLTKAGLSVDLASLGSIVERKCYRAANTAIGLSRDTAECGETQLLNEVSQSSCVADVVLTSLGLTAYLKTGAMANNPQIHLWNNLKNGKAAQAADLKKLITTTLEEGKIVSVKPVGVGVNKAQFVKFENGIEGVWKSADGEVANAGKEVAAYRVDQELGFNIVPVTVPRSLNGVEGTVQLRVTDLQRGRVMVHALERHLPEDLELFDMVIGHSDRVSNSGNWLRTRDGKVIAIDHDKRAFDSKFSFDVPHLRKSIEGERAELDSLRTRISTETDPAKRRHLSDSASGTEFVISNLIDRQMRYEHMLRTRSDVIERLRNTSEARWRKILVHSLDNEEMEAFLSRRQEILRLSEQVRSGGGL